MIYYCGKVKDFREFLGTWAEVREHQALNDKLQKARRKPENEILLLRQKAQRKTENGTPHRPRLSVPFKWE